MEINSSAIEFINFLKNETFVNVGNDDIEVIQKVFEHFRDLVFKVDFTELSKWLQRCHLLMQETRGIVDLDPQVSLCDVALCFKHYGCPELGNSLLLEKSLYSVARSPPRKHIENDHLYKTVFDRIHQKDVCCKIKCVVSFLNQVIYALSTRLLERSDTKSCQKLVDKTVAIVFALLYGVSIYQQNDILGKLSLVIPDDVDKTCFHCLYFSKKALIASILGDDEKEAHYQNCAEVELQDVSPCFVVGWARRYLVMAEERMFEKTGLQFHARCAAFNKTAYLDCLSTYY